MSLRRTRLAVVMVMFCALPAAAAGNGEAEGVGVPAAGPLLPWKGEPVVYTGYSSDHGMGAMLPKEDPNSPVMKAYRAMTGNVSIKWDIVPSRDYLAKRNVLIQSGDLPDVFWNINYLADSVTYGPGLFLDFEKYGQYMPNVQKWAATAPGYNNTLTVDGARYAIQDVFTAEWLGEGWFYNPSLLGRAGILEPPESLAEMMADMKRVKAAVPGADGFYSYWGIGYAKQAIAFAMNAKPDTQPDAQTGKWVYGPTMDPRYREALEYVAAMYQGGLLNPEILSIGGERDIEVLVEGQYAFSYHYYGDEKARFLDMGKPQVLEGMRSPEASDGKRYYHISMPHDGGNSAFMVRASVKRPELLASYIDNIMSVRTYELKEWGIEGMTFRRTAEGGYEFLPEYLTDDPGGPTAQEKLAKIGVSIILDTTTAYCDYRSLWFYKYFTTKGDAGREACAADVKALTAGEMVATWTLRPPILNVDAMDEVAKIMGPVRTYVAEEELKFITGRRAFSDWAGFVAQLNKLGDIPKALAYYNAARQFPVVERIYPLLPPDLR